ncbi:MAG TPA: aminodeoxychorismate synthase component I [Turneriella sp.]|nr:aminodeoxychorismate synthase component I [Turneriella sp.]
MSIKKFNFLANFSSLNSWGAEGVPFVALVSFDGQLLAAPLSQADWHAGQVDFPGGRLHFRVYGAAQDDDAGMDSHGKPAFSILALPPRQSVIAAISALQSEMRAGHSYLVNYCSQTSVATHYSPAELFAAAKAPYTFWLERQFLSFSPEPFVTVRGREISTTPMKGTGTDKAALLADAKEQAEHATVVDLLRNDLGQVAGHVRVEDYRYVSEIQRGDGSVLYQTSSRICGEMPTDWRSHIGDWLPRLLPAGSISGAPKKETLELIRRFEAEPRGFFTGVAVLFDGENLSSAVLIRFLDLVGDVLKFRSGAGITIYSDPAQEYDEIVSKVYFPA